MIAFIPIVVAAAAIAAGVYGSRFVVPIILRRKSKFPPFEGDVWDLIPLGIGFIGMLISGVLADGLGSVWSYFIDTGSFLVGSSLFALSPKRSWPRITGLLIVGIHLGQVIATNPGAPLFSAIEAMRGAL